MLWDTARGGTLGQWLMVLAAYACKAKLASKLLAQEVGEAAMKILVVGGSVLIGSVSR